MRTNSARAHQAPKPLVGRILAAEIIVIATYRRLRR
jgi:hypothetical protein